MSEPTITEQRQELKYKLPVGQALDLVGGVVKHLREHRFEGDGANLLPRARHYVTTVYFDTPSRALYRAAVSSDENIKLRAREYYDVHPELAELATDSRQLLRYQPVVWVEVKRKHGAHTTKRRAGIPKSQLGAFLEHGEVTREMLAIEAAQGTGSAHSQRSAQSATQGVISELLVLREQYAEGFRASCLVNYRRTAWQDPAGGLRVTLDQKLACFAPPEDLWTRQTALVRETLGRPAFEEPEHVLEIKAKGALPAWLDELLDRCLATPSAYSKFVTASSAVYDRPT